MVTDPLALRGMGSLALTVAGAVAIGLAFGVGPWAALAVYLGTASGVIATLWFVDRPGAWLCAVAVATLGPLAGPVLLIAAAGPGRPNSLSFNGTAPEVPLATQAEHICAEIAEGRRPLSGRLPAPSLAEVFTAGDLGSQQAALSALLRHYAPELRPALDHALASDIPAVRVQAAAIYAHLRDGYAARARALASGTGALSGAAREAEINAVTRSGFVDSKLITEAAGPIGRTPLPVSRPNRQPDAIRT